MTPESVSDITELRFAAKALTATCLHSGWLRLWHCV